MFISLLITDIYEIETTFINYNIITVLIMLLLKFELINYDILMLIFQG